MNNLTMTTLKINLLRIVYTDFVQIYVAGRSRHGRPYKYIYYDLRIMVIYIYSKSTMISQHIIIFLVYL